MARKLTGQQAAFARYVVKGHNSTDAARMAGYSEATATKQANQLLDNPRVRDKIQDLASKLDTNTIMDANEVLSTMTSIARGEGRTEKATKQGVVELPPDFGERIRALDSLAKHHGLLTEKTETTHKFDGIVGIDVHMPNDK